MSFVNVAKTVGMMKYSKKEYEQPLNERGNRLVDAIASYWLRKMGSEDLAEKVDKEIGLSKGIQQSVQALEPKKNKIEALNMKCKIGVLPLFYYFKVFYFFSDLF